ncbi:OsmC family protein [Spelaeicoccus albus]|uniref:Putative OsmC-like protein n=1 Tax=Spelaeicoccus albus TaxID=1280376 RepID=A0A7Z0D574_9MICO|nr:OsmC family protein [Spelaeicoccus albus]NYI69101.1 putative OsmC-like protein [Spelaeicoccus albus]
MTNSYSTPTDLRPGTVWVTRTGTRTFTGRNQRGAEVAIGPVEAGSVFTPGELLKVALAGCAGMTSDAGLARRLGDDFAMTVRAHGQSDEAEDRYLSIEEDMDVDLSGLDEKELTRLRTVVDRAIEQHCTVGRTVTQSAEISTRLDGTDLR